MYGIHRLPLLLYDYPHQDLEELDLSQCKVLSTEPLYDISNHIKKLYLELPFHVDKPDKTLVAKVTEKYFSGYEVKNSVDHRKSLLIIRYFLMKKLPIRI